MQKIGSLYSLSRSQRGLIWLFLLYLLKCWLVCTQIGLIVQHQEPECPVEKWDYCVQFQGHREGLKCQWMFFRVIFFWITEHFVAKFGMVMQHYEPECHAENFVVVVAIFKVKVTATAHIIKMLIPWQPNLVWWYVIISQSVLWKKLDYCIQGQGHSKFQNVNECLSRWYLFNHWNFYYQTWYVDASLWAWLSSKKIDMPSSRPRSQWRLI